MLTNLHDNQKLQLILGLVMGSVFGFLLQKGGLTYYQVIIGQLLLRDFTVVKVIFNAVITGMIGVYFFNKIGSANLHPASGSLWTAGLGGLIFGIGFGILGYCPGTAVGAFGRGAVDGLFGILGIMIGVWLFTVVYPSIENTALIKKEFNELTVPEALEIKPWQAIIPAVILLSLILVLVESWGL
jgi:hypothetical protein